MTDGLKKPHLTVQMCINGVFVPESSALMHWSFCKSSKWFFTTSQPIFRIVQFAELNFSSAQYFYMYSPQEMLFQTTERQRGQIIPNKNWQIILRLSNFKLCFPFSQSNTILRVRVLTFISPRRAEPLNSF